MRTLRDIEYLNGVKVLVRVDFNVPIKNGVVVEDFRIKAALPTIEYLVRKGAKVILMSHLEDAHGTNPTLAPVATALKKFGVDALFIKDFNRAHDIINDQLKGGACALLENLRFFDGEKKNDAGFAKQLASLADIYVNDAFSVSHREHASVVGVPKFLASYAGLQFEREVANLSRAFDPAHPFLFILGGAKFETKLPLMERFIKIADTIFVGGALGNDLLKAKGYEVGKSLVSDFKLAGLDMQSLAVYVSNPKMVIPIDVLNGTETSVDASALTKTDTILDMGPKTLEILRPLVTQSRFILWNGPMGVYESGFKQGTIGIASMVSEATKAGAVSIVGGGDTLAAIKELGDDAKFSFISTAGGAMLDFLATGTLPGIEALENSKD